MLPAIALGDAVFVILVVLFKYCSVFGLVCRICFSRLCLSEQEMENLIE